MGVIFSNGVYIGLIPNGGDVTPTPTPTPSPTPIITPTPINTQPITFNNGGFTSLPSFNFTKEFWKGKKTGDIIDAIQISLKDKGDKQGIGEYVSTTRVIPKDEIVVRTNHGIDLPWAGFQTGYDKTQDMWRKSSERRKEIAEEQMEKAKNPVEMLNGLAAWVDDDLQMNVFRIENTPDGMRTIFQWALVPKTSTVYIRPIQTRMDLRVTKEMVKAVVVDNEIIKKTYDGKVKHFAKIKEIKGGAEIISRQTNEETVLPFRKFLLK